MNSKKSKIDEANKVRLQNADQNALAQLDVLAEYADDLLDLYEKNKKKGMLALDGHLRVSDLVVFYWDYEIFTSKGKEHTRASVTRLRERLFSLVGVDICSPDQVVLYAKGGESDSVPVKKKTLADDWF